MKDKEKILKRVRELAIEGEVQKGDVVNLYDKSNSLLNESQLLVESLRRSLGTELTKIISNIFLDFWKGVVEICDERLENERKIENERKTERGRQDRQE